MAKKKTTKKTTKKTKTKTKKTTRGKGGAVVDDFTTEEGGVRSRVAMADDVVATIAGMTAQSVPGIHSLGKSSLIPFGQSSPTRGVDVEVGSKEVALDLEIVIELGCNIRETSAELRRRIVKDVDQMTGRKVIEINLNIIGIEMPEPEEPPEDESPRVR